MSCEQRLCPGVGGRRCGAFMSPLFRDSHPTCARCRDTKCSADVTCDIFKDWSVVQWEEFLKKHPYSGCHKKRPSGSALPTAPPTLLPSASDPSVLRLGFFRSQTPCSSPSSTHPSFIGAWPFGEFGGCPHVGSREVPPPPPRSVGERGAALRGPQLLGA